MTAYSSLAGWGRGWTCRDEGVIVQRLLNQLDRAGHSRFRVLAAIAKVPRQLFVDEAMAHKAWDNTALPIGHGQTISQPTWWRG
jgi:protein-L-isoaspartate(D-aspartate) O-methyltransferase